MTDDDGWERPPPTSTQQRNDLVLAVAMASTAAASAVLAYSVGLEVSSTARPALPEAVMWCVAVAAPLSVRRRYPLGVLVAVAMLFIGLQVRLVPEGQMSAICLFLAMFTAGAWARDRQSSRVVRVGVIVVMFAWLAYALSSTVYLERDFGDQASGPIPPLTAAVIYSTVMNVIYFGAATGFGTMAWNQARQAALLHQRNAELAVERDANAQRAVVAERLRIARELHDVVAHHVSVMGVQAAAARRTLDVDPALSRTTLEGVEHSGRTAVEEMHRLLGVLRTDAEDGALGDRTPAPGLPDLEALVERTSSTGLRAQLTVVGEPVHVPASVSVCAYRIIQEALTNTLRHAAASQVDVRVRHLVGALEVEVVDDGTGVSAVQGSGMGHVGMRERVAMHGGDLEVGSRIGSGRTGFRVRARFPLSPNAAPSR